MLGKFSRDHQWSRWLVPDDALEVCEQMRRLVQAVSELPEHSFELRLGPAVGTLVGDDPDRLREALSGRRPDQIEHFRYEVSNPFLPELSAALRMDRLGQRRMRLEVRGSNRKTVERIDGELRRAVQARLDARGVGAISPG